MSITSTNVSYVVSSDNGVDMPAETKGQRSKTKTFKYLYTMDTRNGMFIERIPFPETCEVDKGGEYTYDPNGINVYGPVAQFFYYFNDPNILEPYRNAGIEFKYPLKNGTGH